MPPSLYYWEDAHTSLETGATLKTVPTSKEKVLESIARILVGLNKNPESDIKANAED